MAAVWVWLAAAPNGSWAQTRRAPMPPRTVAVIDATAGATSDPDVAAYAARLETQLDREADLVPVASERRPALVGAIPDERRATTTYVQSALGRARDALARFDHAAAIEEADRGIGRAASIVPDAQIVSILADLAFVRGLARLGDGDSVGAARDFGLVHRLTPRRSLDPVVYLPEVIHAFEAAAKVSAMASLDVVAPAGAEVWVDGASVGPAPATVQVSEGLHAVTVGGERLVSRGLVAEATAGGVKVEVPAAEASATAIVHRLRRRVAAAATDEELTPAVAAVVRAVGAQDAVVVARGADGKVVTRLYSGRTGVLGEPKPAGEPVDVLKPLRPIRVVEPPGGERPLPPPPPPPWYRRRWVQAGIGGAVVASVLAAVVVAVTRPVGESFSTGDVGIDGDGAGEE